MQIHARSLAVAAALSMLAGCSERLNMGSSEPPRVASAPSVDMTGRWTFSAGGGGACAMNFGPAQGAEGTIRPEGGCPGNFFTSRKWGFEGGQMVMSDHNSKPLAQLRSIAPGRFEGQAAGGGPVALTR
jgi:hypothetical protein